MFVNNGVGGFPPEISGGVEMREVHILTNHQKFFTTKIFQKFDPWNIYVTEEDTSSAYPIRYPIYTSWQQTLTSRGVGSIKTIMIYPRTG